MSRVKDGGHYGPYISFPLGTYALLSMAAVKIATIFRKNNGEAVKNPGSEICSVSYWLYTHTNTRMHTYIHASICAYMYTCMYTYEGYYLCRWQQYLHTSFFSNLTPAILLNNEPPRQPVLSVSACSPSQWFLLSLQFRHPLKFPHLKAEQVQYLHFKCLSGRSFC